MSTPIIIKSFLTSSITGTITQTSGFVMLKLSQNPLLSILWMQIFGNTLAYLAQSYVFGFKKIMLSTILRWAIVVCISLFMCVKSFSYVNNLKKVKEFKKKYTGLKLDLLNFITLALSIFVVFIVWDYSMRRDYIFKTTNPEKNTPYDLLLIGITIIIVAIDRYFYNYKIKN
jgi:heme/copper-type cytochrome/quinol oxidase subunit 2